MPSEYPGSVTIASAAVQVEQSGKYLVIDDAPVFESDSDSPSIVFDSLSSGEVVPLRPHTLIRSRRRFRKFWIVSNATRSVGQRVSFRTSHDPIEPIQSDVPSQLRGAYTELHNDTETVDVSSGTVVTVTVPESVDRLVIEATGEVDWTSVYKWLTLRVVEAENTQSGYSMFERAAMTGVVGYLQLPTPCVAAGVAGRTVSIVLTSTETSDFDIDLKVYGVRAGV